MPISFTKLRRLITRVHRDTVRGQSVAELALILPIMMLLAVAVGDFGRIYASMIALESATREAADYGAFDEDNWDGTRDAATLEEMQRRACTAASSMPGYVSAPAPTYCTNPSFEFDPYTEFTANYGQGPIRIVMARGTFTFTTAVSFPPLPDSVTLVRESRFAVWKVDPLEAEGPTDPPIEAPETIPTPTPEPTPTPSPEPTPPPTPDPTPIPTPEPSSVPTPVPSPVPTPDPTPDPTPEPTPTPTPSRNPNEPSPSPSDGPPAAP
jgi:Flp pilus assembly protein TadG